MTVTVPGLFSVRPLSVVKLPPRVMPPFTLVMPVPDIVPPDHVVRPLTVTVSEPVSVPTDSVNVPVSMVSPLLKLIMPVEIVQRAADGLDLGTTVKVGGAAIDDGGTADVVG